MSESAAVDTLRNSDRPRFSSFGRERAVSAHRYRRRYGGRHIELNIIPLVDVTFLLMIFFVIAGTFEMWEGVLSSKIFPSIAGASIPLPLTPVRVNVRSTGSGADDFALSVEGVSRAVTGFDDLVDALKDIQRNPAYSREMPVVIVADPQVLWDHVVSTWNAAVRAGYRSVAFGGG